MTLFLTLEEIAKYSRKKNALVFIDNSVFSCEYNSILNENHQIGNSVLKIIPEYNQLSIQKLDDALSGLEESFRFFENPNVAIIDEVQKEFEDLVKYVCFSSKRFKKWSRGKSTQKRILQTICGKLREIQEQMPLKEFPPINQNLYDKTFDIFEYLVNKLKLKKESDLGSGKITDEKLAASAFYAAVYENTPSYVLTQDKDIPFITSSIISLFDQQCFSAEREQIAPKLAGKRLKTLCFSDAYKKYAHKSYEIKFLSRKNSDLIIPSRRLTPIFSELGINEFARSESDRKDIVFSDYDKTEIITKVKKYLRELCMEMNRQAVDEVLQSDDYTKISGENSANLLNQRPQNKYQTDAAMAQPGT